MVQDIFDVNTNNFEKKALAVFRYQAEYCKVYSDYLYLLKVNPEQIDNTNKIPFLPIELFKTHDIISFEKEPSKTFFSSGTTNSVKSRHIVADLEIYKQSALQCFNHFYGPLTNYCFLFLLPSYLENKNASLVYMAELFVKQSGHNKSGFYLYNYEELAATLQQLEKANQKTILFGVTFALLDFAEKSPMKLDSTTILETGGMKGRREELTRYEVHKILKNTFGVNTIHSEYGMTELLSQGYSKGDGIFNTPPWMKIIAREANDPLTILKPGQQGGINIIDLANIYSCSFIATADQGKVFEDGSFEITGRLDNSDIRGCNLMYEV